MRYPQEPLTEDQKDARQLALETQRTEKRYRNKRRHIKMMSKDLYERMIYEEDPKTKEQFHALVLRAWMAAEAYYDFIESEEAQEPIEED